MQQPKELQNKRLSTNFKYKRENANKIKKVKYIYKKKVFNTIQLYKHYPPSSTSTMENYLFILSLAYQLEFFSIKQIRETVVVP